MKCLGILAGPRKGHATDKLIDAVLDGIKAAGNEVEKISLYDYDIKPCSGCCACHESKKCVIDDDHHLILEKMDNADIIVFGSPSYWSNVTSEAKKFMDRSSSFFEMKAMGPKRTKKTPSKIVIATTCGVPWPLSHIMGIVPGAMGAMRVFFGRMSAKVYEIYGAGMMDPARSIPSARILKKAFILGKSL